MARLSSMVVIGNRYLPERSTAELGIYRIVAELNFRISTHPPDTHYLDRVDECQISMPADSHKIIREEEGRVLLVNAAKQRYGECRRIELASLASELGVGRASAYRWFGDNDRLLAAVLIERTAENFRLELEKNADKTGRARVQAVIDAIFRHEAQSKRFAMLLARDPKRAMKVIGSDFFPVRNATTQLIEKLLTEEQASGHLVLTSPSSIIAAAIVRILEGYLYANAVAGEELNIDTAMRCVAAVIH